MTYIHTYIHTYASLAYTHAWHPLPPALPHAVLLADPITAPATDAKACALAFPCPARLLCSLRCAST